MQLRKSEHKATRLDVILSVLPPLIFFGLLLGPAMIFYYRSPWYLWLGAFCLWIYLVTLHQKTKEIERKLRSNRKQLKMMYEKSKKPA